MGGMEGGLYSRIMSTRQKREGSILPLSYQQFLWQGTRCFQKVTPEAKKCDRACLALASVVREGKDHPSLKGLKSLSRRLCIEAAIPYVTQACAAMLSKRQPRDRLSPSVIKLLSTLHWIFLESPLTDHDYRLKYETIEAFVKEIIPCVEYVDVAKDLVGNGDLRRGAEPIWDCLQRHVAPDVPSLNYICRQQLSGVALDTRSSVSSTSGVGVERVSVFDIAVVRSLGTTTWPDRAVEWALKYLSLKLMGNEQKKRAKRLGIPDIHITVSALGSISIPNEAALKNLRSQSVDDPIKEEESPKEKTTVSRTVSDNVIIIKTREQLKQREDSNSPKPSHQPKAMFTIGESSSNLSYSSLDRPPPEKKLPKQSKVSTSSIVAKDDIDLSYYLASDYRLSIPAIFEVITYQLLWGQSGFSSRVYEEMLNLMRECLSAGLQNFVLMRQTGTKKDKATTTSPTYPPQIHSVSWTVGEEIQFLHKALWTTLLLLRHLGCCEHGCKYGIKGRQGRRLHALASQCLTMIARHDLNEFKKLVRTIVIDKPLSEVFSCLHGFFCFCTIETDTTLQNCVASSLTLQTFRTDEEAAGAGSFNEVYGLGMGDVQIPRASRKGNENIEEVMAKVVLSHLVSRMLAEDLKKLNNLAVAHQFCQFVSYLNAHHTALLRRLSFTAIFDSKIQKQTVSRTHSGPGQLVCEDGEIAATCNEWPTFSYGSMSVSNPGSPHIARNQSGKKLWKKSRKSKGKTKLKSVSSRRSMDHSPSSAYLPVRRRHISFGELDPIKAVDLQLVRYGLKQFSVLLGCSELGALPSGNTLAAVLDLDAPVISKAALLLECCFLIHQCRNHQLTVWMCTSAVRNSTLAVNIWNWGLALGNKLSEILMLEKQRKQV